MLRLCDSKHDCTFERNKVFQFGQKQSKNVLNKAYEVGTVQTKSDFKIWGQFFLHCLNILNKFHMTRKQQAGKPM